VQSFGAVTTYIAREKGYFKDVGIDIDIVDMNSSANVLAILARGDLQIVEGGVSAGFFNALEQNLPVIMVADRVSTPIGHQMIVAQKNQGKISKLQDLKGLTVGSNGPGSITTYEVGKMLETVGMKLDDVDIKILGFSQMGPALASGALDAAQRFFVAYMRATRDYCVAYHGGPNRKEVIDIALKNGLDKSAESLEKNIWTGRTMDGVIKVDSMLDIQDYYKKVGLTKATFPADRIVTREFVDYANQKLGPPPKTNPDSKLENCR
jgi:NitT/TauT family transport system substrate-binding protein